MCFGLPYQRWQAVHSTVLGPAGSMAMVKPNIVVGACGRTDPLTQGCKGRERLVRERTMIPQSPYGTSPRDTILSSTPKHLSISSWCNPQVPGFTSRIFEEYSEHKSHHSSFLLFPVLGEEGGWS